MVRVNMADGRAVYLGREDTATSTYTVSPQKPIGEVVKVSGRELFIEVEGRARKQVYSSWEIGVEKG